MKNCAPSLLVFASVPPPEHGQNRMVATMIEALEAGPGVVHVDARFSEDMEELGRGLFGKMLRVCGYLREALAARWRAGAGMNLYYVPGPVTWAAVVRDWVVLGVLRPWFRHLVLHWHAIGQGEWAHGSRRCRLRGPAWLDRCARVVSAFVLGRPALSVVVSATSGVDARAVESREVVVVNNGIEDPCADYEERVAPMRRRRAEGFRLGEEAEVRVLFMSRGTEEKGLFDALRALEEVVKRSGGGWCVAATFAGGVALAAEARFVAEGAR
ncbi:MAG: hypothetical protein O3A92_14440, partial [Verrucomicrobia bacterium]|nr:hypothetical protein [Verrucomicrobiota bacterium]